MAIQKRATGKAGIQVPKKTGFKVEDHQLTEAQTFPRSKKLKNEGVKIDLTLEQEIEYMKCALDSIYFAKNYYKITSIDEGFILFEPFDYQEDLLKAFEEHRFVIDMQCRQSGKCVVGETVVKLRRKSTGEEFEATISEFHNMVSEVNKSPNKLFRSIWGALHGVKS